MRQKGLDGEKIAAKFLQNLGYKIISKNFHSRFGEIDIIVKDKTTIVFVEVKMRSNNSFGTPLESITYSKIEKIKKTAFYFLTINNLNNVDFRIDAVEVLANDDKTEINHLKNITL